ncbi:MAG: BNR-4 repeat-containing protein [Planctomycetes bacterium]|nr:BNR-4 repeat-containing protein [Planctomycetota bacterium]
MERSAIVVCLLLSAACAAPPAGPIALTGAPEAPNGAWCWFQDPRALVDVDAPDGPRLLVGSVSFAPEGSAERGDLDLLWLDVATGARGHVELRDRFEQDDHDVPALLVRADGRYLAVYAKHGSDRLLRARVSTRPHDPSAWQPERTLGVDAPVTYANVFRQGGRLVAFCRAQGWDPNRFASEDEGETWRHVGRLLTGPRGNDAREQRPYPRYAQGPDGAVHVLVTDGHPRNEDNGVYHGVVRGDALCTSDGRVLGPLSRTAASPYAATDLTPLLVAGETFGGVAMHRGWTLDLTVDGAGAPHALFQARAADDWRDHRLFHGRWDGERWRVREIARLGAGLYEPEHDYTGLACFDPADASTIFVSTPVDPRDGAALAHHELFLGRTSDGGARWTWRPLTWDSARDQLRPQVPRWDDEHVALLWLDGAISSYTRWDAQVLARTGGRVELDAWCVAEQAPLDVAGVAADAPARR